MSKFCKYEQLKINRVIKIFEFRVLFNRFNMHHYIISMLVFVHPNNFFSVANILPSNPLNADWMRKWLSWVVSVATTKAQKH